VSDVLAQEPSGRSGALAGRKVGFGVVPDLLEKESEVIEGCGGRGVFRTPARALTLEPLFQQSESPLDIFLV